MSDRGPLPTTGLTALGGGDAPDLRTAVDRLRTLVSGVLGAGAALGLAASVVVALSVQHAFDDEHPWAWASVVLTVPQVREEITGEVLGDLEDDAGAPFTPTERAGLQRALDDVLASTELRRELADLTVVDGRLDGDRVIDAAVRELEDRAADAAPREREVLSQYAADLREATEREGTVAEVADDGTTMRDLRGFGRLVAGLLLVPAAVCAAVALAVARRRGQTAVAIGSGGLALAAVLLSPGRFLLDHLPGPLEVPGVVLSELGALVGTVWLWALVLLAVVPPALWWVLGSARGARNADEGAGPHWVP
ncbi:hypothetical protein KDN32_05425 [Nocardioides sp. J2M5]|uniref:hypothetical protein n=1 Tax=Nocardioides palaemonis TaxID=2829810 RepID=UPI001BA7143E|nr:hypothetical protein [Nocardioides palaemonis]MBS2937177.1 hypothetical protein [Nocardioides palaemonis]